MAATDDAGAMVSPSGPATGRKAAKVAQADSRMNDSGEALRHLQKQLQTHARATLSQYAVIWFDSRGHGRVFASPAYQDYLERWIPEDGRQEARRVAVNAAQGARVANRRNIIPRKRDPPRGTLVQSFAAENDSDSGEEPSSNIGRAGKPMQNGAHPLLPLPDNEPELHVSQKRRAPNELTISRKKATVSRHTATNRTAYSDSDSNPGGEVETIPQHVPLRIGDADALTTFYTTRLCQMQQLNCRLIAKVWIKVIQPKKQSNFAYKYGDSSKPPWWPKDIKHQEPDHLKKHERIPLMLTVLRCGRVPISKLQAATAEVVLPNEIVPLLDEVYRVATHEDRCRRGEISPDTEVYVAFSDSVIRRGTTPKKKSLHKKTRTQTTAASESQPSVTSRGHSESVQNSTRPDVLSSIEDHDTDTHSENPSIAMQSSQTAHNPFSGPNAPLPGLDPLTPALGYATSYVTDSSPVQTEPLQEQQQFMESMPASSIAEYQQRHSVSYPPNPPPPSIPLPRNNSMPEIAQLPSSGGSMSHNWSSQIGGMYSPYSPNTGPSHYGQGPYGISPRGGTQSMGTPPTPASAGSFHGLQLPQQPASMHQGHHQGQILHPPPLHGLRNQRSGPQYDQIESAMEHNAQPRGLGFTDFLQNDMSTVQDGADDGNHRAKIEPLNSH